MVNVEIAFLVASLTEVTIEIGSSCKPCLFQAPLNRSQVSLCFYS